MKRLRGLQTVVAAAGIAGLVAAQSTGPNTYLVHNLVSDLPGIADHQDANLVNAWGNGFSATSPFWIGNNGSGTSTLYDGTGAASALVVTIPQAGGAGNSGPITGVMFNSFASNTNAFAVSAGKPSNFIFCSEDGVISGWNSSASGTKASILFDNSKSGAVYKGCALGGTSGSPLLFAANFNAGTVDVYDGSLNLNPSPYQKAFVNSTIPAGFAPFNVQLMNGTVFVTYAKQDSDKHDDVAGAGNGYVAMFNQAGVLIGNLLSQGSLNSPWGMAVAPASFGQFGGALLVGNFGDGKINAYDPASRKQLGALNDATGNAIAIPGLWSLNFGPARNADPGTLYFTAGIGGGPNNDPVESHGLLGSIQAVPFFQTSGVVNAGSLLSGAIAPNEWVAIKGNGLSATTGSWSVTGSTLPTSVNGVGVTVDGTAVPVSFVSNQQINFLVPGSLTVATAQIQVTNNGLASSTISVPVNFTAPGFFAPTPATAAGSFYIAATHIDGTLVGPTSVKGATPAQPGETIALFATGFGTPMASSLVLQTTPTIVVDGIAANVIFAGMTEPGVYQFNVTLPKTISTGDVLTVALQFNSETQGNAFLPIVAPVSGVR